MNVLLVILAALLLLVGLVGAVVPGLPGPPLSWLGMLLLMLAPNVEMQVPLLIGAAVVAVVVTVIDYVVPSISTKRFGGTKAGVWGCNVGLVLSIVGLPFGPGGLIGMVFWPFVGAFVGEKIGGAEAKHALRAAMGAFLGFLSGTMIKLVYGLVLLVLCIRLLL
ncbi:MAG: DUF456 domain-containing protein [Bacteroidales bacterium]|nr:DUF456 domain-containing protein [Bacteroidales bacterium]MBR1850699.1 DUF456 domain-containing protein [Bacteroidales bacterium]